MKESRLVQCPECGATRETRANRGTRLVCEACGESFRCPAPEVVADAGAAPIERATPVIRERARPDLERGAGGRFATKLPQLPAAPVVPPPVAPGAEAGRRAGRRGGLAAAHYRNRVGR